MFDAMSSKDWEAVLSTVVRNQHTDTQPYYILLGPLHYVQMPVVERKRHERRQWKNLFDSAISNEASLIPGTFCLAFCSYRRNLDNTSLCSQVKSVLKSQPPYCFCWVQDYSLMAMIRRVSVSALELQDGCSTNQTVQDKLPVFIHLFRKLCLLGNDVTLVIVNKQSFIEDILKCMGSLSDDMIKCIYRDLSQSEKSQNT